MADKKESEIEDKTETPSTPKEGDTTVPEPLNESLDSLTDNIANSQPEVNAAAGTPQAEAPKNNIPDDDIARDKDGNIKYKKDGVTPMKKRGRKAGSTSVINNTSPLAVEQDKALVFQKTGEVTGNFLISMSMMVGGEEFAPQKDDRLGIDERLAINDAFASYFKETGKEDLPPNLALTMVLSAYFIPRFFMPQTKSRVVTLKDKFNLWRENRRIKKIEKEDKKEKEDNKDKD